MNTHKWKGELSAFINTRQRFIGLIQSVKSKGSQMSEITFVSVLLPYKEVELEEIKVRLKTNILNGRNLQVGQVCNFTADILINNNLKRSVWDDDYKPEMYIDGIKFHSIQVDPYAYKDFRIENLSKYCIKSLKEFVAASGQEALLDNYIYEAECFPNIGGKRERYVESLYKQLAQKVS